MVSTRESRPVPRPRRSVGDGDGAFAFDPAEAVAFLRKADRDLARLMDRVGPFRMTLKQTPSLFLALAEAIVYQQLHGKAAATIHGRVMALFPRAKQGPSPLQFSRASDEALRGAGLSRNKLLALRDLAEKSRTRQVPTLDEVHDLDDEEIVERLTHVRGIGRWTVEMLLMFRLGRPDVLPLDDFGVRKGFGAAFLKGAMASKEQLRARGERWRPYRSVASWYMWRAAEMVDAKG